MEEEMMNGSARTAMALIGVMIAIGLLFNPSGSTARAQDSNGYWQLIDTDTKKNSKESDGCRMVSMYLENNTSVVDLTNECSANDRLQWSTMITWSLLPKEIAAGQKVPIGVYMTLLYNHSSEQPQDYVDIKLSGGDGKTLVTILDKAAFRPTTLEMESLEARFTAPELKDLPKSAGNRINIIVTTRAGQVSYIYEWVAEELEEKEPTEEDGEDPQESDGEGQVDGTVEPTKSGRTRTTPTLPAGCVDTGTRFSDLSGKVDVAPFYDPEDFDTAGIDMVICVGDRIRTGRKSSAILSMGDLSTYVMKPETTIILDAPLQHDSKIKVVAGNIWINIKKTLKDGSMEVIMNEAVLGIKGTTLIAEETGSESRLKVIEGAVAFKSLADGESLDVSAGETIAGTGEGLGEVEVFDIAAEEAEWQEYLDGDRYKKNFFDSISASIPVMAGAGLCGCLGIGGLLVVAVVIVKRRRKTGISQSAEQQPESGTIYCIQCGKTNQPGAAFCRNCGKKIEA
jgi:hypothetical protein